MSQLSTMGFRRLIESNFGRIFSFTSGYVIGVLLMAYVADIFMEIVVVLSISAIFATVMGGIVGAIVLHNGSDVE